MPKEIKDITVSKTAGTKGENEWTIEAVGLENTYINCFPGKVDQVYTAKIAEGCGIGKILMLLCLNEGSIHNVENNEENRAMKDIQNYVKLKKRILKVLE